MKSQHLTHYPGRIRTILTHAAVAATITLTLAAPAHAGTIEKANNTTAMNATGSWTGGAVPGSADVAQWNSTVGSANASVSMGGTLNFGEIVILNPGADVSLTATTTRQLTLNGIGGVGIDLSGATRNLTISDNGADATKKIILAANQTWNTGTKTLAVTAFGGISGAFTLTKAGSGTLALNSADSYSGGTILSAGIIRIGDNAALGTGGLTFAGSGTLQAGDNNLSVANGLTINSGLTATLDAQANAFTLNGNIQDGTGAGAIIATGSASSLLLLGGTNAYTGGTTVKGGALQFAKDASVPASGSININTAGALAFSAAGTYTTANAWLTSGKIASTSAGALALTGSSNTENISLAGFPSLSIGALVNNSVSFTGTITPGANGYFAGGGGGTILFPNAGNFTGSNAVTVGNGGGGVVVLSGTNSYSGVTKVVAGVLRANDSAGLPSASNLTLNAGVFETSASLSRALGTAAGQVQITGGVSGFSAQGGPVSIDLSGNNAGAGYLVTWGATSFKPSTLVLNGASADSPINFTNGLDLSTATTRTINVNASVATLSGPVSATGGGGLVKSGNGTLLLSNSNTYAGGTTVNAGVLQVSNPLALAAGPLTVAAGGTVDLNGTNLQISSLNGTNGGIITDASSTPGTTTLTANIPAAGSTYSAGIVDGVNRVVSLTKSGPGILVINNNTSANTFTGGFTINQGQIDVRTNNAVLPKPEPLTFTGTGLFAASNNSTNAVTLGLGNVTLVSGDATIQSNNYSGSTGTQTLTIPAQPTRSAGATLNFTLANTTSGTAATPSTYKVVFSTLPTQPQIQSLDGGIFFGGNNFAAYDTTTGYVRALAYTGTPDPSALELNLTDNSQSLIAPPAGSDVQLEGGNAFTLGVFTGTQTIRSLKINDANNISLADAATNLVISGGGIIKAGGNAATISGPAGSTITGSAIDLVVNTVAVADNLTVGSNIVGTGGLTKTGQGTLVLSATANSYAGTTAVNAGTLNITGTLSALSSSNGVTVASGATLTGAGQINRPMSIQPGGTLAIPAGVLNINGEGNGPGLTLANGAIVTWTPSATSQLDVDTLVAAGSVNLVISSGTNNPDPNFPYIVAAWSSAGPTSIAGWTIDPASGYTGTLTYQPLAGSAGEIVATNLTPVPEPGGIATLALASAGLLLRRKRATT